MKKEGRFFSFAKTFLTVVVLLDGCTAGEVALEDTRKENIEIALYIAPVKPAIRAPGDMALSVDRLLILPFRKNDPEGTDEPSNYVPVYDKAKQLDVGSFPLTTETLTLSATQTYQLLMIGYNRKDYDFTDPENLSRRFGIGPSSASASLATFYLQPADPTRIPEFFVCLGEGYKNTTPVGTRFTPSQINHVKGRLQRLVGGLTLEIHTIPVSVSALSLTAEQLVTAARAFDGAPLAWQTAGDSGNKLLGTQTPVNGKVVFNTYMLPTSDERKTLFYLDITTGSSTERFTLKVADSPLVVSNNRIIFSPNQWVYISGKYTDIKPGFFLTGSVDLDDNAWDGVQ